MIRNEEEGAKLQYSLGRDLNSTLAKTWEEMSTTAAVVDFNTANSSTDGTRRRRCNRDIPNHIVWNVAKLLKLTITLFMFVSWNYNPLSTLFVSAFMSTCQPSHSTLWGKHYGHDVVAGYGSCFIVSMSSTSDSSDSGNNAQKKKKKKKGGLTVNPNLVGSISSDGNLEVRQERPKSSTLGVPSKRRKPAAATTTTGSSATMSKKDRQRTGNGTIDSQKQTLIANKENEPIQVLEAKRGNKVVTIVRYVSCLDSVLSSLSRSSKFISNGTVLLLLLRIVLSSI